MKKKYINLFSLLQAGHAFLQQKHNKYLAVCMYEKLLSKCLTNASTNRTVTIKDG